PRSTIFPYTTLFRSDFAQYKHATLERRVKRRMVLRKFESPQLYADHLRTHAIECQELFDDILLHVTGFFRDASLFQAFRRRLFPDRKSTRLNSSHLG